MQVHLESKYVLSSHGQTWINCGCVVVQFLGIFIHILKRVSYILQINECFFQWFVVLVFFIVIQGFLKILCELLLTAFH